MELSYLERMRRCSKRQSLARTVKTHQEINGSQEHVPLKRTSWYTVAMTEQAVSSSSHSHTKVICMPCYLIPHWRRNSTFKKGVPRSATGGPNKNKDKIYATTP